RRPRRGRPGRAPAPARLPDRARPGQPHPRLDRDPARRLPRRHRPAGGAGRRERGRRHRHPGVEPALAGRLGRAPHRRAGARPCADSTRALAAARAEPRRREAHLTAAVEAREGLRPGTSGRLEAELILAHEQRTWHRVIELERALRVASRQGGQVALYFLADALEATGDRAAAAAALERLATHPRGWEDPVLSVRAWRRLGEVREALGDRDGAAAAYRELIARRDLAAPDDPDLVASRRGLSRLSR